jgi:hypothetical protein
VKEARFELIVALIAARTAVLPANLLFCQNYANAAGTSAPPDRTSSTQLPQIGSFRTVNRVFEEHLRLRDTSDEPAVDLRQSASG